MQQAEPPSVLIIGTGKMAPGLASYLQERAYRITIADRDEQALQQMAGALGLGQDRAFPLDIIKTPTDDLARRFEGFDVVVSIVPANPPALHVAVARACIEAGISMVTASYLSEEMSTLDAAARKAGVVILSEMGLDPGIDHISAIMLIRRIQQEGGVVTSFSSYCGGIPAPETAPNFLGRYKFSWSPAGAVSAAREEAMLRRDGQEIIQKPDEFFQSPRRFRANVEGVLRDMEGFPNRDSIAYIDPYGVAEEEVRDFVRGTLRWPGWGDFWRVVRMLGWPEEPLPGNKDEVVQRINTLKLALDEHQEQVLVELVEGGTATSNDPPKQIQQFLASNPALAYEHGERDMVVMQHGLVYRTAQGQEKEILSELIQFGDPEGLSAMAFTVGTTLGIGVDLVAQGKIEAYGCQRPTDPTIAQQAMPMLEREGISFTEVEHAVR